MYKDPPEASMAEWLKRPTHNWQIRRFNSCWMHTNGPIPIDLLMYSVWNWPCINRISLSIHNELVWYINTIGRVRTRILIDTETHREENGFMDGIKYAVFTEKSIRLLGNNINILLMSNQDLIGRK